MRMPTPVAKASRVTNGPNTHRSLTTHPKPQGSSKLVVYAALAGNLLVSATKFIAASVSGSASMMSEGVHSLVDTLNEVLLLYGMHRSKQTADRIHPLGYGRELYFWSFVVAVLLFALGGGVSVNRDFFSGLPSSTKSCQKSPVFLSTDWGSLSVDPSLDVLPNSTPPKGLHRTAPLAR